MALHLLKCWPGQYEPVIQDLKYFEIRQNDRDYKSGDILRLQEFIPDTVNSVHPTGRYTGRECEVRVHYIMSQFPCGAIDPEYVVMSIHLIRECGK